MLRRPEDGFAHPSLMLASFTLIGPDDVTSVQLDVDPKQTSEVHSRTGNTSRAKKATRKLVQQRKDRQSGTLPIYTRCFAFHEPSREAVTNILPAEEFSRTSSPESDEKRRSVNAAFSRKARGKEGKERKEGGSL